MKFGVREICDVVFKAKNKGNLGSYEYVAGQPVLYIDSAKTSTVEGASTTVYATGGRGNSRLIAWEGEKTLTFTVEDALLSPMGFAILSGAGLFKAADDKKVYVHHSANATFGTNGIIDLKDSLEANEGISATSPIFVMAMDGDSIGTMMTGFTPSGSPLNMLKGTAPSAAEQVFVDFYVEKTSGVDQLEIDAENFAGYYYVEASTLFRRQVDGKDLPAEIIFPNVKIQSNFTFTMASTGDPSTFTFTMDAMPGYTRFDLSKRVLCAIQIVEEGQDVDTGAKDSANNNADDNLQYPLT